MLEEFKLRAYDKQNGLWLDSDRLMISGTGKIKYHYSDSEIYDITDESMDFEIFTGSQINGEDIYVGDILKTYRYTKNEWRICVVERNSHLQSYPEVVVNYKNFEHDVYGEPHYGVFVPATRTVIQRIQYTTALKNFEKLGNIHDNPELLYEN